MANYTDPGLAIKKLAANVKAKMARKLDKPTGSTGQLVYNATTDTWEAAPALVTDPQVAELVTYDTATRAAGDKRWLQSADAVATYLARTDAYKINPGLAPEMACPRITTPLVAGSPKPVGTIAGRVYGFGEGRLRTTTDGGATWTVVAPLPPGAANVTNIGINSAGQLLLCCSEGVWVSRGWGTDTITWSERKITPNGIAAPQPFSFSGYGQKWIYGEYGVNGTQGFTDSRYAYISTDGGETWTRCWDSDVNAPASTPSITHIHGVCYDRWGDTFYLSEGHGADAGIYHSTDDGKTWGIAPGMKVSNLPGITASPTTVTATDEGLVCGGDSYNVQGLHGVVRTPNPMDQVLKLTWSWRSGRTGNNGWGHQPYRDPETGLVYVMYRSQSTGVAPIMAAGTPTSGSKVYEWPGAATFATADTFLSWAMDSQRRAIIYGIKGGAGHQITGLMPRPRAQQPVNTGNLEGGISQDTTSVAVGLGATTGDKVRMVAIGVGAKADTDGDSVVIGSGAAASAGEAVTIGSGATSAGTSVAIGKGASSAPTSVAIGPGTTTVGTQTVAIGRNSKAANANAIAIGYGADCTTGTSSVALGANSATTASYQVAVGDRYFELGKMPTALASPAAGKGRLAIRDDGSGKLLASVAFPSVIRDVAREAGGTPTVTLSTSDRNAITGFAVGDMVFDTTLKRPVWHTGSGWVDASGVAV